MFSPLGLMFGVSPPKFTAVKDQEHRLNMYLELQSLFGLHVTWCAQLFSLAETPEPPPPDLGS